MYVRKSRRFAYALLPSRTDPGAYSNTGYSNGHHRRSEPFRALTDPVEPHIAYKASGLLRCVEL